MYNKKEQHINISLSKVQCRYGYLTVSHSPSPESIRADSPR